MPLAEEATGRTGTNFFARLLSGGVDLHAGKLDGIGPAYYADADQLDLINAAMDGIRAWP